MPRLRCCGRFCFWKPPTGPWMCGECGKRLKGAMPKNAQHRFDQWRLDTIALVEREGSSPERRRLMRLFFKKVR